MHRKLRELAGTAAGRQPFDLLVRPVHSPAAPSPARTFAERVAAALEGPVLRYGKRRGLIADSKGLGIGEFEANLIIAAVQHERRCVPDCSETAPTHSPSCRLFDLAPYLVAFAVESLLALGVW